MDEKGQIGALTFKNKDPKTQQRPGGGGHEDSVKERTRSLAGLTAAAMSSGVSPSPSAPSQDESGAAQRLQAAAAFGSNSLLTPTRRASIDLPPRMKQDG